MSHSQVYKDTGEEQITNYISENPSESPEEVFVKSEVKPKQLTSEMSTTEALYTAINSYEDVLHDKKIT